MYLNDQIPSPTEKDLLNNPYVRWGLALIAIAAGFLAMDIMLRRPLLREVAAIKREFAAVDKDLKDLVGVKDQAWETSHLLGALHAQKRQLDQARAALAEMREFRQRVEIEAQQTSDAMTALERVAGLQQRVAALNKQLRDLSQDTEQAAIDAQKLGDLRTKVLENAPGVEDALGLTAELLALKDSLQKADGIDAAKQAADQLLTLRESLRPQDDATEQSQAHAEKLLALRDGLIVSTDDTIAAARTWDSIKQLASDLRASSSDVAQAIETLELLTDFNAEFQQQSETMNSLRKGLMDIVLLETTVGKAMRVLEPLSQLKNLARLNEQEVRAAARAILDQRGTKLTRRDSNLSPSEKLPQEDELFRDESPMEIGAGLVPLPRDVGEEYDPAPPSRAD